MAHLHKDVKDRNYGDTTAYNMCQALMEAFNTEEAKAIVQDSIGQCNNCQTIYFWLEEGHQYFEKILDWSNFGFQWFFKHT